MALTSGIATVRSGIGVLDLDTAFARIVVVFFAQALHWLVPRGSDGFRVILFMLAAYAVLRLLSGRGAPPSVLRIWPLVLLLTVCGASLFVSAMPGATIVKLGTLGASVAIALHLAWCFKPVAFLNAIAPVVYGMIALGSATALFIPSIGQSVIDHHAGSWSGLWGHRMMFAAVCVLGLLVTLNRFYDSRANLGATVAMLCAIVAVLYMCNAKMSLAAGLMALAVVPVARWSGFRRIGRVRLSQRLTAVILGGAVLCSIPPIIAITPQLPEILGRDATLSGRVRFWDWGQRLAAQHRWTGAGYRTFWQDQEKTRLIAQDKAHLSHERRVDAALRNGHNGYLDVYFDLGFVGASIFAIWLLHWSVATTRSIFHGRDPVAPVAAGLLAYVLARNLTETVFLEPVDLFWLMSLWTYASIVGFGQADLRDS